MGPGGRERQRRGGSGEPKRKRRGGAGRSGSQHLFKVHFNQSIRGNDI